jgi:hypothetical protein
MALLITENAAAWEATWSLIDDQLENSNPIMMSLAEINRNYLWTERGEKEKLCQRKSGSKKILARVEGRESTRERGE